MLLDTVNYYLKGKGAEVVGLIDSSVFPDLLPLNHYKNASILSFGRMAKEGS